MTICHSSCYNDGRSTGIPTNGNAGWQKNTDWAIDKGEGWMFKAQNGPTLKKQRATPIRRHVKVKGRASPYDGDVPATTIAHASALRHANRVSAQVPIRTL